MQPTIKDVARQAGVSTATVSRVLNDSGGVCASTRIRVEHAIADLGYHYNAMAGCLKKQQSGLLGHIVPSIVGPVAPILARAAEEEAQKSGFNVILCNSFESAEKEKASVNILLERRVAGILFSAPVSLENVRTVRARGVPVAIIERRVESEDFHFAESDNMKGAYDAVTLLVKLGHRRIALILGPQDSIISKLRQEGYNLALADAGIRPDSELTTEGDYSRLSGYNEMKRLLTLKDRPTGVFAANDTMAIGAMQAVRHAGLNIPEDISIVGFDDAYAELAIPMLTSVHQPLHETAVLATKIVIAGADDSYPLKNVLPCTLMERESTGPAPAG